MTTPAEKKPDTQPSAEPPEGDEDEVDYDKMGEMNKEYKRRFHDYPDNSFWASGREIFRRLEHALKTNTPVSYSDEYELAKANIFDIMEKEYIRRFHEEPYFTFWQSAGDQFDNLKEALRNNTPSCKNTLPPGCLE